MNPVRTLIVVPSSDYQDLLEEDAGGGRPSTAWEQYDRSWLRDKPGRGPGPFLSREGLVMRLGGLRFPISQMRLLLALAELEFPEPNREDDLGVEWRKGTHCWHLHYRCSDIRYTSFNSEAHSGRIYVPDATMDLESDVALARVAAFNGIGTVLEIN